MPPKSKPPEPATDDLDAILASSQLPGASAAPEAPEPESPSPEPAQDVPGPSGESEQVHSTGTNTVTEPGGLATPQSRPWTAVDFFHAVTKRNDDLVATEFDQRIEQADEDVLAELLVHASRLHKIVRAALRVKLS